MKQFFKFFFASMLGFIIGAVVLVFLFVGVISVLISSASSKKEEAIESNAILHLKFDQPIVDRGSDNPFSNFDFASFSSDANLGLNDFLEQLEKAKTDDAVKGVFIDIAGIPQGMSNIEEIRNKLLEFKASKKFIVCYGEYFSQTAYYLSSVADQIYLNPQGEVDFKGLGGELMFFKGALEKLGIEPQIIRHGKFKSAVEPFMLDKMSDENRKQTQTFLFALWDKMLQGISKSRNISVDSLNSIANRLALENANDAIKLKMVDKLAYRDEVLEVLRKKTNSKSIDDLNLITLKRYQQSPGKAQGFVKDKIAVVYAVGSIESGEGDDETIGSDRISQSIREARLDDKIKAIVLRVNSPGGSALASEVIWREVFLARKAKPVIVSMGNVAASGGYYIACAADTIVASPNTITGSIGVFGVLFNGQKLFNNTLGITIDTVKTNSYSDIGSVYRPLSGAERDFIQRSVENVYEVFVKRVAEGRKMRIDQVDSIGQGRVWSGIDAKRIGLVDVLGGMETAVAIAAKKANLKSYKLVSLPEQQDPVKEILTQLTGEAETFFVKRELGEQYHYYKAIKNIKRYQGIQARIPFELDVH
jgi:protease-4